MSACSGDISYFDDCEILIFKNSLYVGQQMCYTYKKILW